MSYDLTQKVKIVNPHASVDELYGTYNSVASALAGVPTALRQIGRTVGIVTAGVVDEYWFKNGITDSDLVLKELGATGDFIPITGTEAGNPVTGNVEFSGDTAIFNDNIGIQRYSEIGFRDGQVRLLSTDTDSSYQSQIRVAPDSIIPSSSNPFFQGITYDTDYRDNFTDFSLPDVGWVNQRITDRSPDLQQVLNTGSYASVSVDIYLESSSSFSAIGNSIALNATSNISASSGNGQGIVYSSDYSATLSSLSLTPKVYVDTNLALKADLSGAVFTGDVQVPSIPVNANSAVTKNYIDNLFTGITWKQEVKAATTANITLSGLQTVDGVSLSANDRVLVKNQSTASQNGIYNVSAGSWTRTIDADTTSEIVSATVSVRLGTVNKDTQWTNNNTNEPVIGTDAITFAQIAGAGTYTNGTGILLTGNVFSADSTYISTATQTALNLKANLSGGNTWSGTQTALSVVTQSQGNNSLLAASTAYVDTGLATKQATLVSGTNIKTVGLQTVLGSGDITSPKFATIGNTASDNNSLITLATDGTYITRDSSSGGSVLTLNQTSSTSTSSIFRIQRLGSTLTEFTSSGIWRVPQLIHTTDSGNSSILLGSTGTVVSRNKTGTGIALKIVQQDLTATGNIFQAVIGDATGGTEVTRFTVSPTGAGFFSGEVSVATPTLSTSATTKAYVDGLFLSATATLDFPSTSAGSSSDLTVTVTGAALSDVVSIGVPSTGVSANTCYTAWVSAADTVTIRFNNYSAVSVNPASGSFKIKVFK